MYTSDEPHLRSWFGHQAASKNRSAPAHAIGNATRAAYAMHGKGRASPGPIYMPRDTAIQRESAKVSFGTGPSVANETTRASTGPAPGAYDVVGSVGYQASSAARNAPSYRIGTMQRDTTGHDHGRPQGSSAFYNLRESWASRCSRASTRARASSSARANASAAGRRRRARRARCPARARTGCPTPSAAEGLRQPQHAGVRLRLLDALPRQPRVLEGKDTGGGGDAPGPIYSTGARRWAVR